MTGNELERIESLAVSSEIFGFRRGYHMGNGFDSIIRSLLPASKYGEPFCRF
jgi:hypothetical protein